MAASSAAVVVGIKNYILRNAKTLGNSDQEDKHLCSELLGNAIRKKGDIERIAEGTFLCVATIERMRTLKECKTGATYYPSSDTCARILRYFGMEASWSTTTIKSQHRNKPKSDVSR